MPFNASPVYIAEEFQDIKYDGNNHPGSNKVFSKGANCQVYAYAFLKSHGLNIPNLRSKELWHDQEFTYIATDLKPFDILLYNNSPEPWGAHVAVYLGQGLALHLSKENSVPRIERLIDLQKKKTYRFYIGAKRVKTPS